MTVLLALASAGLYGLSDFVGGIASRRTSAWPVAVLSGLGGLAGALVMALVAPGSPVAADWWWAGLAGGGSGVGIAFLYRGFAAGQMAVAGPVSAVGTALLPVLVGVLGGESLGLPTWVGVVAAVPGLWLVSRPPSADGASGGAPSGLAEGLIDGMLAGAGFGVAFVALGQWTADAGYAPFVALQGVDVVTIAVLAAVLREAWLPRSAARPTWWGLGAGLLGAAALALFVLAVGGDNLAVVSVLTALYPAFTVVLAVGVLRERVSPLQAVGLALCAGTVALVAAG